MLSEENVSEIKKEVEGFFEKMTFDAEVEVLPSKDNTLSISIKTEDPQILIGEAGLTLMEIQYILKAILRKKLTGFKEPFYVDLDINDYKKKKIEYLREMAKSVAEEVLLTKQEKELPPMPSYERRIVHMELAEREGVVSESIGEEPERRVVIRLNPSTQTK